MKIVDFIEVLGVGYYIRPFIDIFIKIV